MANSESRFTFTLENSAIDFNKYLVKCHQEPISSDGFETIYHLDNIDNLPVIVVKGQNAIEDANNLLEVIKKYLHELACAGINRLMNIRIAIEYESLFIQISFSGKNLDLSQYLAEIPDLPSKEEGLENFMETACSKIPNNSKETLATRHFSIMGFLNYNRVYLSSFANPDEVMTQVPDAVAPMFYKVRKKLFKLRLP